MTITFNRGSIAWLCFVWAALILLGLTIGLNVPFVLAVIGTLLMLFVT
jgi:hypothetical protein